MGRNPRRASGVKALQAIKESSQSGRAKKQSSSSENPTAQPGVKRISSPGSIAPPKAKRNALGDVTNLRQVVPVVKPVKTTSVAASKKSSQPPQGARQTSEPRELSESASSSQPENRLAPPPEVTPVTAVKNFLQATTLDDTSLLSEESLSEDVGTQTPYSTPQPQLWKDIDQAEAHDHLFSSEYAPDVFHYMRQREIHFAVQPYLSLQPDITASMRTILVDWLIEVQENFELFHETLYLAVKLVDLYLARKEVKREYLQLVGATCMLISSKFEELSPPLVDDFLYLCDDAYTHEDLLKMERDILRALSYDINIPVAYRFLRRLARAAEANMETHTLARYISESTLQESQFIDLKPSLVAAAAMYLALRMRKLGGWTATLQHYSGYSVEELLPLVERFNTLLQTPLGQTTTVRSKYSHEVFFKVALTPPLKNVREDAELALIECPTLQL